MDDNREWTRFGLTNPPANGDPMATWHSDVLWVILDMNEKARLAAEQVKQDLINHPLLCVAAKRVNILWSWYGLTLGFIGSLSVFATLIYFGQRIFGKP